MYKFVDIWNGIRHNFWMLTVTTLRVWAQPTKNVLRCAMNVDMARNKTSISHSACFHYHVSHTTVWLAWFCSMANIHNAITLQKVIKLSLFVESAYCCHNRLQGIDNADFEPIWIRQLTNRVSPPKLEIFFKSTSITKNQTASTFCRVMALFRVMNFCHWTEPC